MESNEYQEKALRTECDQDRSRIRMSGHVGGCNAMSTPIRFNHGCIGIVKEAGELLSVLEKWIYYGKEFTVEELKQKVLDESGDVLWYLQIALDAFGITLDECMQANVRKLSVRYPDKYTDERTEVRDREAERAALSGIVELSKMPNPCMDIPSPALGPAQYADPPRSDPSHTWKENKPQTHCTICGAYKHLSSGFRPCTGKPPDRILDEVEQDGHGFGHSVIEGEDPNAPK
jgi:NTP pyrophosphatase (non-canonical NTP hydrolase)